MVVVVGVAAWWGLGGDTGRLFNLAGRDAHVPVEILEDVGKTALRDAIIAHYHARHSTPLIATLAGDPAAHPETARRVAEFMRQWESVTVVTIEAWRPFGVASDDEGGREEIVVAGDYTMEPPPPDGVTRRAFRFETGLQGRGRWRLVGEWDGGTRP